jgi:cytochrome b6-f complex iron-sulfur subunit
MAAVVAFTRCRGRCYLDVAVTHRPSGEPQAPSSATQPVDAPKRRDILSWILGSWATGVFGAVFYPIARFLVPPEIPEAQALTTSAGSASDLAPNSGRVVPFGNEPALVIRTPDGELRAFSAQCTHLSCIVQYRDDLQGIWCACHNGHYDLNGRNVSGPPPRPLPAYQVSVRDDELILSRES